MSSNSNSFSSSSNISNNNNNSSSSSLFTVNSVSLNLNCLSLRSASTTSSVSFQTFCWPQKFFFAGSKKFRPKENLNNCDLHKKVVKGKLMTECLEFCC